MPAETLPADQRANELPAARRASEQAAHYRALMMMIRDRTDVAAKGLGTIGAVVVTAIGLTKLTDVFPYYGPWWALVLLAAGFAAMVVAVILLVHRFADFNNTILADDADAERTFHRNKLTEEEFKHLKEEYREAVKRHGVESLRAYDLRGRRFERIADRVGGEKADILRARADVIKAEVLATEAHAVVVILRGRARKAFFGVGALGCLVCFLFGCCVAAIAADELAAQRSEHHEMVKEETACAELGDAGAKLPGFCREAR